MPERPFAIAVCSHRLPEARAALAEEGMHDVELVPFPARCGHPRLAQAEAERLLEDRQGRLSVAGGVCLDGVRDVLADAGALPPGGPHHCLEDLADRAALESWQEQGAYVVSPGWLSAWRRHIEDWGFDQPGARAFFGESVREVLLLDTGVLPGSEENLAAFAAYLGLPARRVDVGLGHLRATLARSVLEWRLTDERQKQERSQVDAGRRTSAYALAFSQLGVLASSQSEAEAVTRLLDLFAMLTAAGRLGYRPLEGEAFAAPVVHSGRLAPEPPPECAQALERDWAWAADKRGFALSVRRGEQRFGVFELDDFVEPERAGEYLNLLLDLRGVCALSIAHARSWAALAEAEAHRARIADQYRLLAVNADGLVVIDDGDRIRFVKEAGRQLLGVDRGERLGVPELTQEGTVTGLMLRHPSGDARVIDARVVRCEWHGDDCWLASLRDVTEARAAQEAAQRNEKMSLLGQLAGGVAHDFNNVVQAVSGSLELALSEGTQRDEVLSRVRDAMHAADRGAELARRLLLFSKPRTTEPQVIDIAQLVGGLAPLLRQVAGSAVRLEVEAPPEPLPVRADPAEMEQFVVNLVANARDAVELRGRVEVRAGHRRVAPAERIIDVGGASVPPGDWVQVRVQDDGSGIPAAVRTRIFDPFFTTKPIGRGTGLGLASVRRAVETTGGHLLLDSKEGDGTQFDALLPLAPEGMPQTPRTVSVVGVPVIATGRVLIVDDEPAISDVLGIALRRSGIDAEVAGSAAQALEILDGAGAPDLLVTDISMPGMDGYELARAARERFPDLRVLFMSGLSEIGFEQLGIDPEGISLLSKPFRLAEAIAKVFAVLQRGGEGL